MESLKSITRRININFAFVQGSGWMSHCVFACYAAVYLSSKGISDTQTGITLSLAAVLSILLQTVLSDFSDRHPSVPLKRITSIITITLVCTASILCLVPASAAVIMILFIIGNSCTLSLNGFMNALMMQHNNTYPFF